MGLSLSFVLYTKRDRNFYRHGTPQDILYYPTASKRISNHVNKITPPSINLQPCRLSHLSQHCLVYLPPRYVASISPRCATLKCNSTVSLPGGLSRIVPKCIPGCTRAGEENWTRILETLTLQPPIIAQAAPTSHSGFLVFPAKISPPTSRVSLSLSLAYSEPHMRTALILGWSFLAVMTSGWRCCWV